MGIFYNPPPPPTANTAGTPPEPHVPIGTQGTPPPRYTTALMLVAVLASWAPDLEPRLARPNNQQQKIAPLTRTYGGQPTPTGPITANEYAKFVASWPLDLEPRLGRPNAEQRKIAPLTLTYGSQPTPQPSLSVLKLGQIVSTWVESWGAQTAPKNAAWNVPPLLSSVPCVPLQKSILGAWEPAWSQPPRPVSIATLTLPTGMGPPFTRAPVDRQIAAVSAWTAEAPVSRPIRSIAWNVVVGQVPNVPLPALIWQAWQEPIVRPIGRVLIAPLMLVYGVAPQPQPPLSVPELTAVVATWVQTWNAQAAPKNGPLPAAFVPGTPNIIEFISFSGQTDFRSWGGETSFISFEAD